MSRKGRTSDAVEILRRRYVGEDPDRKAAVEAARVHAEVARTIYELRTDAELTQQELADLVGTTQSVISRLEDEEYEGHSISMLNRIAKALNRRIAVLATNDDPASSTMHYAFRLVLQDLRRSRGLTINKLAQQTGIDRDELITAERSPGYKPTPLTLHRLSNFYGLPERKLAALAGAFRDVPREVVQYASRFAAQSESFAKLTDEERAALDQFIHVLKSEQ
ncbi:MAG: helix-turn-helix domain-containing protein [Armatimonadetes bacterium]|nr:helix-turn-helix domain-containing protein [Armatimonadota bacterium]